MCRKPLRPSGACSYFVFPLLPTALRCWDVWLAVGEPIAWRGGCRAVLELCVVAAGSSHVGLGNRERNPLSVI